jgi:hypothetical protein
MSVDSNGAPAVLALIGMKRINADVDGAWGLGCLGGWTPDHAGAHRVAAISTKLSLANF